MPLGRPMSLPNQSYVDIVAFLQSRYEVRPPTLDDLFLALSAESAELSA